MNGTVSTESGPWARGSRCTRAATASTASRTKSRAPKRRRTPSAWPTSPTSTTTTTSSSRAIANVSRLFLFVFNHLGFTVFFYRISHEFLPFFFGCGFHQLSPVSFFSSAAIFFGREGGGVLFLTEFRFGFAAFYDFDRLLTGLGFAFLRFQTARRSFPFSRFVTESERESNWAPEKKIIRFKWRDMEKQHLTYLSPVSSFVNPVKPGRNFSEL